MTTMKNRGKEVGGAKCGRQGDGGHSLLTVVLWFEYVQTLFHQMMLRWPLYQLLVLSPSSHIIAVVVYSISLQ